MNMTARNADIFPSIGARFKASVIDSVVIILLVVILATIYMMIGRETPIVSFILFSIALGYEPILVWKRGMTIGHQIMGFRVVDVTNKCNITLGKASLRFLIKGVLGLFSFVWALFTDSQKTLHDVITKSSVVSTSIPSERLHQADLLRPSLVSSTQATQFVQRSKSRRIFITILWELIIFVFVCVVFELIYPRECLEDRGHIDLNCQTFDLFFALVWGSLSIIAIVFGSAGRLPGAKRTPSVENTVAN